MNYPNTHTECTGKQNLSGLRGLLNKLLVDPKKTEEATSFS